MPLRSPVPSCARGLPGPWSSALATTSGTAGGQHQAKNGHVGAFCAYMVAKQLFHTVTLNFLMVGHTHEDVDQVFSLLVSQVIRRYRYETVQDLKQYMEAVLGPSFCKDNQQFHVKEMTCIRKFTEWLKPLGVTQHGCWATRKGIEAPHSFTYKFLMDLTGEEQAAATHHSWFRSRYETSAKDVMCCVKTYMRDTHLQQAPLCVLPLIRWTFPSHLCRPNNDTSRERTLQPGGSHIG